MTHDVPCLEDDHGVPCLKDDHGVPCLEDDHAVPCLKDDHVIPHQPEDVTDRQGEKEIDVHSYSSTVERSTHSKN